MIDLDDPQQLVLYDSQGMLAQAAAWQGREPAGGLSEEVARLLERCLPEHPLADNPAKQLARQLNERIPLFWADERLAPLAQEWQRRVLHYAEAAALSASLDTLAPDWSMARFPRYFPNAVTAVWLRDGRWVSGCNCFCDAGALLHWKLSLPGRMRRRRIGAGASWGSGWRCIWRRCMGWTRATVCRGSFWA